MIENLTGFAAIPAQSDATLGQSLVVFAVSLLISAVGIYVGAKVNQPSMGCLDTVPVRFHLNGTTASREGSRRGGSRSGSTALVGFRFSRQSSN